MQFLWGKSSYCRTKGGKSSSQTQMDGIVWSKMTKGHGEPKLDNLVGTSLVDQIHPVLGACPVNGTLTLFHFRKPQIHINLTVMAHNCRIDTNDTCMYPWAWSLLKAKISCRKKNLLPSKGNKTTPLNSTAPKPNPYKILAPKTPSVTL